MNKEWHICVKCGFKSPNFSEAEFHVEREHKEELEEGDRAEYFIDSIILDESEELSDLDKEIAREKSEIQTVEEETPDETTEVLDAKDLEEQLFALKVLENWDKLDETLDEGELKAELLSKFLGQEQGHDKEFARPVGTKGALTQYIRKTLEHLRFGYCDFCNTDFEHLASEYNVKISPTEGYGAHKELSYDELKVMITHVKAKHPQIYEALKELFESELPSIEVEEKEPHVELPRHVKKREQLSKEELALEITKDENLEKEFLRRAFAEWNRKRKE